MFVDENNSREKLIIRAKAYLEEESKALSNAEKSRNESTTRNRIDKELKTMKAEKFIEEDLISAYRDKNQIEQAFKDVKSFIKIQPFNVSGEKLFEVKWNKLLK